jgi:hypothetical protein
MSLDEKTVSLQPAAVAADSPPLDVSEERTIAQKDADITLSFLKQYGEIIESLPSDSEAKLLRKLYVYIMTLLVVLNLMLFVRGAHPL